MIFLIYLPLSLYALKSSDDETIIGEETLRLKNKESFCVNFTKPYGILLIRDWKDCTIKYDVRSINDGTNFKGGKNYSNQEQSILIGLYLHETIGTVTFTSTKSTTLSFSWATFPKECNMKYVQNVKDGRIKLQQLNIDHDSTFCFYSSAPTPLHYKINYNISQKQIVTFIQQNFSSIFSINGVGVLNQVYNESTILTISNNMKGNINILEIAASSNDDIISQTVYNSFISYDNITFLTMNINSNKPRDVRFTIFGILGTVIVVLIVVFSIIGFRRRNTPSVHENAETDSSSDILSRPPTPEHIQIEQFHSDSADGDDTFSIHDSKDEFALDYEGYPQNDYNPSNVEYEVPKPVLLNTVLNEINAKI